MKRRALYAKMIQLSKEEPVKETGMYLNEACMCLGCEWLGKNLQVCPKCGEKGLVKLSSWIKVS